MTREEFNAKVNADIAAMVKKYEEAYKKKLEEEEADDN